MIIAHIVDFFLALRIYVCVCVNVSSLEPLMCARRLCSQLN